MYCCLQLRYFVVAFDTVAVDQHVPQFIFGIHNLSFRGRDICWIWCKGSAGFFTHIWVVSAVCRSRPIKDRVRV